MKVMLLSLPGFGESDSGMFPLGIGYLVGILKQSHEVKAYHYQKMRDARREVSTNVASFKPDIVGLTCNTFNRDFVRETIKLIRAINKNIKIVVGGVHASFLYNQILKQYDADVVIIGEGEYTFLELCNFMEQNIPLKLIKGIAYKENNEVVLNQQRQIINNLDDLPIPDYSYGQPFMEQSKMGFIITSRGCPVRCTFCSTSSYWGQKVRMHSPSRVVDEMEGLISNFNIKKIFFHDDTFNLGINRVKAICEGIKDRGIKIEWGCSCRVSGISEEMISSMVEAGCRHICWGVESGSEDILKDIDKKISISQIRHAFELSSKFSNMMSTASFTMVGNPGESERTTQDTVSLFNTMTMTDRPSPSILYVLPGTLLYENLRKDGHIRDEDWFEYVSVPSYTLERSYWTLSRWAKMINNSGKIIPFDTQKHFWNRMMDTNMTMEKLKKIVVQPRRLLSMMRKYLPGGRIRF